ncbi:thioredoxin domain-containing protein [uncultured Winogradskyella sp.]|uniref:thioredoxin domain-containing protein n=1 Tax=uncultured Winogradskyella sp. TaxID=395353 RepID=UPI002634B61C|nr:thioredoxin domain-containing protein [uncultured Winogradskyella sp.]
MLKNLVYNIVLLLMCFGCNQNNSKTASESEKANDLIHETSPYLLQHAYNPVDWKAWNQETLQQAKDQNKLIVVSVGYSACHWCHVMEEESFENDSIAKLMNRNFINIKVDREERPDVDQLYMSAVQLMTGSGGWPLNCITLPDGRPVFGGTYFTKTQWQKILEDMSALYTENPAKMISYAEQLTEGIKKSDLITVADKDIACNKASFKTAITKIETLLDYEFGGQKGEPKFPMPTFLNLLLRYSYQTNNQQLQNYVMTTLTKMSNGGIYDHVGGGFSRYSVDEKWHIPHFEKMLYDNAQLISLYSKAYQISSSPNFKTVVAETINFIDNELTDAKGGFYAALDADSANTNNELEEGAYYIWQEEELRAILKSDFELFSKYYNINTTGKWEDDKYVLYKTISDDNFIKKNTLNSSEFNIKLKDWKKKLSAARKQRTLPRKDDKVLTSWNAIMLKGLLDAYRAFGTIDYLEKAKRNAKFIVELQMNSEGKLFHNYKNGVSSVDGFAEDYAHTISAFIDLYQITSNEEWLRLANTLMQYSLDHLGNDDNKMFYFTSQKESDLITRKTEVYDNVIASSNSVFAESLFKLGHYYGNKAYSDRAKQMLKNVNEDMLKTPSAYTNWLNLYLNYANAYYEVAISGKEATKLLNQLNKYYIPNILISASKSESNLPLLKNKYIIDETLVYVCVNGTCKLPVNSIEKAMSQISK